MAVLEIIVSLYDFNLFRCCRSDEDDPSGGKYARMEDDSIQDKERFARYLFIPICVVWCPDEKICRRAWYFGYRPTCPIRIRRRNCRCAITSRSKSSKRVWWICRILAPLALHSRLWVFNAIWPRGASLLESLASFSLAASTRLARRPT